MAIYSFIGLWPKMLVAEWAVCFVRCNNQHPFTSTSAYAYNSTSHVPCRIPLKCHTKCARDVQHEMKGPNVPGTLCLAGGGGRYLIPETSLLKLPLRAAATAALLSFYCCSVARGAHPGNHQAAQRQKKGKFLSSLLDLSERRKGVCRRSW